MGLATKPTHASGEKWANHLRGHPPSGRPILPVHHPRRFDRPLSQIAAMVPCCSCDSNASVVAIGSRAKKGTTVEAFCPRCGYQTIYYR